MGLDELINTLKKNERKQIEDMRQAAENEAEDLRKHVAEEITAISKKQADQLASACRESTRAIFAAAGVKTRKKKLFAYKALEQALRNAAINHLPELRDQSYEKVFAALAAELPDRQWEIIVVNPADVELAANFFPGNIIHPDSAVSGGLKALTANRKIIVDNTFEKRLERKWPHILPALIETIEKQYERSGFVENTGSV